jgi:chlorite dismutase
MQVNHTYNFLNPLYFLVNTQRIERSWRTLKSIISQGTNKENKWTYIAEYEFKMQTRWYEITVGERIKVMMNALKDIKY